MGIQINPNFKSLIPALQPEEYEQLRQNILDDGEAREAILTWHGYIVDGHNRYEICTQEGLPYETREMEFENEQEARLWILHNQLGRRNLTDAARIEIAMKLKDAISAKAKQNQLAGLKQNAVLSNWTKREENQYGEDGQEEATSVLIGTKVVDEQLLSNWTKAENVNTRTEIAKIAGVSNGTVARYQSVKRDAPEPIIQAMKDDAISINRAYEITKQVKDLPEEEKAVVTKELLDKICEPEDKEDARRYKIKTIINKMITTAFEYYEYATEDNVDIYVDIVDSHTQIETIIKQIDTSIGILNKLREMFLEKNCLRRVK